MCWGKVLTRQPEISQARREERVGESLFRRRTLQEMQPFGIQLRRSERRFVLRDDPSTRFARCATRAYRKKLRWFISEELS